MHIDIVPNRGSRPAYLLRESFRDGARVRKRTLANLSSLSDQQILAIRAVLRGEPVQRPEELFEALHACLESTLAVLAGRAAAASTDASPGPTYRSRTAIAAVRAAQGKYWRL